MMMKISTNKIVFVMLFIFFSNLGFSQGLVENELNSNLLIVSKYNQLEGKLKTPVIIDTLSLGVKGILDDFSYSGPYPDTTIWIDNKVFINRDFAKAPITLGIATFDGLDETGYPYDFTAGPTTSAVADYLTSKPINLNYPATDSIYFSFYCQPQGIGNAPEYQDSLVLQFKHSTAGWRNIWAKKGSTLSTSDSTWDFVMIPITDTAYLKDDFQFRFFNRATISGNTDHWNVDYVYLNRIRNVNDTTFEDVSFVYNTPSLLNTYSAMPWKQYDTTDMKTLYATTIRNNHTVTKNGSFIYKMYDDLGAQVNATYSGGSFNIDPFATTGYMNYAPFTTPPVNYKIPLLTNAERFTIECILSCSPDNDRMNDTVRHVQDVTNYFSYDDGTAENSFGMSTLYAQLAEKFVLKVADSMQYIDIYFNPFLTNASIYSFNLNVWSDGGSAPGAAIYTGANPEFPTYSGVMHNQFIRYKLDAPLYLSPGTFYVGFTQNTNQFINIGVDKNINSQSKIFYNVSGVWNNSPFFGSLMLHPVFGSYAEFTGIEDSPAETKAEATVFPNPVNDRLYIDFKTDSGKNSFSIIDLLGKTIVGEQIYSDYIDVSFLENGVYFVQLKNDNKISTLKFIKLKQ